MSTEFTWTSGCFSSSIGKNLKTKVFFVEFSFFLFFNHKQHVMSKFVAQAKDNRIFIIYDLKEKNWKKKWFNYINWTVDASE